MKTAIVLGSARSNGDTAKLVQIAKDATGAQVYDLAQLNVQPYCYNSEYKDDFTYLIEELVQCEHIVLASPMYWYAPSAQMKAFIDRLSDLLGTELGRKLKRKFLSVLAVGNDKKPPECFESVFKMTFEYMGMAYQGMVYSCSNQGIDNKQATKQVNRLLYQMNTL